MSLEDEDTWDPIEDVVQDERGSYIDLIRHFLWMASPVDLAEIVNDETNPSQDSAKIVHRNIETDSTNQTQLVLQPASVNVKKAGKKARQKAAKQKENQPQPSVDDEMPDYVRRVVERIGYEGSSGSSKRKGAPTQPPAKPDKDKIETRDEIFKRLNDSGEYKHDSWSSVGRLVGSIECPDIPNKDAYVVPEEELRPLMDEIAEIKQVLFCRLLLSHAALLPATLKANSVEESLADADIPITDLRDLCLQMEDPGQQEIRDACADLARPGDEPPDDEDEKGAVEEKPVTAVQKLRQEMRLRGKELPQEWKSKIEQNKKDPQKRPKNVAGAIIDFGELNERGDFDQKKMRVKICGKSIWNCASENAMSRKGWLHFCIIANGTPLFEAVELCRNWREFYELNVLATFSFFPSTIWSD